MRRGESALDVVLWLAIAALLGATALRIAAFAPLTRARPSTVVSNGDADAKSNEPLLLFLSKISALVPEGSTFSLVPPSGQDPANWLDYMIAVGQLPGRRVIFAPRFVPPRPAAHPPPSLPTSARH